MADLLIFEFSHPAALDLYREVNQFLGIDPDTNRGDWPAGMLSHQAGSEAESLFVVESWESRAAQEEFMHGRLGPALEKANAPQPVRVTWLQQVGDYRTG
jgi:hypothetical protein